VILSYQGNDIEQRDVDGYVNLTQMAKLFNKRVSDWSRTESAKAYLEATSTVTGICVTELLLQTSSNPSFIRKMGLKLRSLERL
jgi:hypothetical protein